MLRAAPRVSRSPTGSSSAWASGILLGWLARRRRTSRAALKPLSTIFLRMIKSVVVPIIFGTLVVGIAGHGDDLKRIGRLAVKSIGYFWIMTTVALAIGLIAVNLTRPGRRRDPAAARSQRRRSPRPRRRPSAASWSTSCPRASSRPRRDNEVLQVVFWATLFAIALTQVRGPAQGGDARLLRRAGGGDVQVRRHRDEVRADRHRRGDGGDGEPQRHRRAR